MIIESGAIIFAGLMFLFIKLPPIRALQLLGYHLWLDIFVSILAFIMHYGTFSGVMSAAVAGLMCSAFTSLGRKMFGYIVRGIYTPGYINLTHKYHLKRKV